MKKILSVFLLSTLIVSPKLQAYDFKVNGKIDLVSDYVWRGAYQNSGFSVQPTLALSYRNLSLSAWGSRYCPIKVCKLLFSYLCICKP